jgi:parvulin-like peptidyl-prolyl isomerase
MGWLLAALFALLQAPAWAQTSPAAGQLEAGQDQDRLRPDLAFTLGEDIALDNAAYATWILRIRGPIRAEDFAAAMRIEQRCAAEGIEVAEAEVQAQLEAELGERLEKAFSGDREAWLKEVQQEGLTERGLRTARSQAIRQELLAKRLTAAHWTPKEDRLQRLWEFRYGPQGRGMVLRGLQRRIVNEFDPATMDATSYNRRGDELRTEAIAELAELRARALAGESFSGLARRLSDDVESKASGGRLPGEFWNPEGWPDEIREALLALQPGEISAPLLGRGGVWIFELISATENPLEEVRDRLYADMLASGPETDEISAYVDGLAPELPLEVLPALYAPKLDDAAGWQAPVVRVGSREYNAADYDAWLRRNEGELIAQRLALLASVEQAGKRAGIEISEEQIEARIELDKQLIIEEAFKGRPELWENDLRSRRRTTDTWLQEARERARMDLTAEALLFADENWLEQHLRFQWSERYGADGVQVEARQIVKNIQVSAREEGEHERRYMNRVSEAAVPLYHALEKIKERTQDGEDFGALAKRESEDSESARLGGVPPGGFQFLSFDEVTRSALMNAKLGEVVGPFQSGQRMFLFEVLSKRSVPYETERAVLLEEARGKRLPAIETGIMKNKLFKPEQVRFEAGLYR